MKTTNIAIAVSTALFFSSQVSGAVIVANVSAATLAGGQTSTTSLLAANFLSPSVATSISSVVLPLEQGSGLPAVALSLYSDNLGVPGALLAALGAANVNGGLNYTFTPGAAVNMNASTSYWLVLGCTNCSSGVITNNWKESTGATVAGLAGADVELGIGFSSNGGGSWGIFSPDRSFVYSVNGDVTAGGGVPEPSTVVLVVGGLAVGFLLRRRQ